jgi:hypothetical protein
MKTTSNTITSLPPSPEQERRKRMIEYTIMMAVRVLCVVACIWVRGWWLLIPALGAGRVERPGAVERFRGGE